MIHRMTLPDVGEGVAEAELVEWLVAVGDEVTPESVVAEVLTDKATVEVSSPVAGVVTALHGEPGDVLAVGGDLIEFETGGQPDGGDGSGDAPAAQRSDAEDADAEVAGDGGDDRDGDAPVARRSAVDDTGAAETSAHVADDADAAETTARRPLAAPAVRARARDLGIDLASVAGSGPDGRVLHADLDRLLVVDDRDRGRPRAEDDAVATPVRGVRRRIAARLSDTWQHVPHITYVEAIDATELQRLREALNREADDAGGRLTILPFIARAMVIACAEQPGINAHYDHEGETLTEHAAVHVGIATQTDAGLLVPVVRHAEARGLRDLASEIIRVTAAARDGSATRHELAGSTITITSLGAIGGIATTPIINAPEVAIVGVNKLETRPVWRDGSFQPRELFNLSCSFDHRMVDGWDAAVFVQRLKALLETPALLFVGDG